MVKVGLAGSSPEKWRCAGVALGLARRAGVPAPELMAFETSSETARRPRPAGLLLHRRRITRHARRPTREAQPVLRPARRSGRAAAPRRAARVHVTHRQRPRLHAVVGLRRAPVAQRRRAGASTPGSITISSSRGGRGAVSARDAVRRRRASRRLPPRPLLRQPALRPRRQSRRGARLRHGRGVGAGRATSTSCGGGCSEPTPPPSVRSSSGYRAGEPFPDDFDSRVRVVEILELVNGIANWMSTATTTSPPPPTPASARSSPVTGSSPTMPGSSPRSARRRAQHGLSRLSAEASSFSNRRGTQASTLRPLARVPQAHGRRLRRPEQVSVHRRTTVNAHRLRSEDATVVTGRRTGGRARP